MAAPNESNPDAPSKIDQRRLADENTGASDTTSPEHRRASNIRAYHQAQIAEAEKTIAAHKKIVEEQNVILGEVEDEADEGDVDSTSPIPNGTDIGERFNNAFGDLNGDEDEGDEGDEGDDEFTSDDEFASDDESDDTSDEQE